MAKAKRSTLLNPENIKTLELYVSGKSESEVGEALGLSRGGAKDRLSKYREAGILEGSFNRGGQPVAHWDKLEDLKKGPSTNAPQPKPVPRSEPTKKRVELTQLTEEEVRQVRFLLRDKATEESPVKTILRSAKSGRSIRVCDSLWDEVTARAEADNVNATHIVEKALKQFLNVEYK